MGAEGEGEAKDFGLPTSFAHSVWPDECIAQAEMLMDSCPMSTTPKQEDAMHEALKGLASDR